MTILFFLKPNPGVFQHEGGVVWGGFIDRVKRKKKDDYSIEDVVDNISLGVAKKLEQKAKNAREEEELIALLLLH